MRTRTHVARAACALALAWALAAAPALAKQKPKPATPKAGSVTEYDVRACVGAEALGPDDQAAACTKVINSGKIHHGHEGDFYASRGGAYYISHQFDLALADYNKALTFERKPEFLFQRALTLLGQGDEQKAKADLEEVMKIRPDFAPSYFIRGLIAYHADNYKGALADYEAAIQRKPTYYQAIFARGVAKSRLSDGDGKDDLKQARGINANVDDELQKLGVVP